MDNKLKMALLVIERYFKSKQNYSSIVARPRSIVADEYFLVNSAIEEKLANKYGNYFTKCRMTARRKGCTSAI